MKLGLPNPKKYQLATLPPLPLSSLSHQILWPTLGVASERRRKTTEALVKSCYHTHFPGFQFLNGAERGQQRPVESLQRETTTSQTTVAEGMRSICNTRLGIRTRPCLVSFETAGLPHTLLSFSYDPRRTSSEAHSASIVEELSSYLYILNHSLPPLLPLEGVEWAWGHLLPYITFRSAWFRSSHMHPTWLPGGIAVALMTRSRGPGKDIPNMVQLCGFTHDKIFCVLAADAIQSRASLGATAKLFDLPCGELHHGAYGKSKPIQSLVQS